MMQSPLKSSPNAILVLGMHRSGTSALTGSLDLCGVTTPVNQIKPGAQNPKGFFEAAQVARLNDRLLYQADMTWEDWQPLPSSQPLQNAEWQDEAVQLINQEFAGSTPIALKDPRICRFVPFWGNSLQAAGYELSCLLTVRHPSEVAQSLNTRNRLPEEQGMLLWLTYCLEAEWASRRKNRSFTSFDHLMSNPHDTLSKLTTRLGIELPNAELPTDESLTAFLNPNLRHHVESNGEKLPAVWQEVYNILTRWARYGEDIRDHKSLDTIRTLCHPYLSQQSSAQKIFQELTEVKNPLADIASPASPERLKKSDLLEQLLFSERKAFLLQESLTDDAQADTTLSTQVARQTQELATLSGLLLASEDRFDALTKQIEEQRDQQESLNKLQTSKSTLETNKRRLSSQNADLHNVVAKLEAERQKLEDDNDALHALVARVENERHAIASSTLWRATKPIRIAANLFRRPNSPSQ